jgi:hypothetical protein
MNKRNITATATIAYFHHTQLSDSSYMESLSQPSFHDDITNQIPFDESVYQF